jgi:hypothetical protein
MMTCHPSSSIKVGEFLYELSCYQLLKEDFMELVLRVLYSDESIL